MIAIILADSLETCGCGPTNIETEGNKESMRFTCGEDSEQIPRNRLPPHHREHGDQHMDAMTGMTAESL